MYLILVAHWSFCWFYSAIFSCFNDCQHLKRRGCFHHARMTPQMQWRCPRAKPKSHPWCRSPRPSANRRLRQTPRHRIRNRRLGLKSRLVPTCGMVSLGEEVLHYELNIICWSTSSVSFVVPLMVIHALFTVKGGYSHCREDLGWLGWWFVFFAFHKWILLTVPLQKLADFCGWTLKKSGLGLH